VKAITQDMQSGDLRVQDVPPPALQPGGVLVRVRRSLISLGTERAIIALAHKGPLGKAKERPDLVRKVMNRARQEGLWSTYQVVKNLISSPIPLGYSCAGEVMAVGRDAPEFRVGDRVACAGLNFANHAEVDYVPRNLTVKLPATVPFDAGAFVTVGAIAMQGVRLAELTLGECVVVYGLGLVGQLTAQIARCNGAAVVAYDPDPAKVAMALRLGATRATASASELKAIVTEMTDGSGADAVLLCAATKSDAPIREAADLSRLKGRVVVVGDVGLNLERRPYFEKEISLVVSRSYGPGRYDPSYEVRGTDYPLPWVRWTERRNMQSFVELLERGGVEIDPLVTHRFPIADAERAYEIVTGKREEPAVAIVLEYEGDAPQVTRVELPRRPAPSGGVALGVLGAGQFAKGILLPLFLKQRGVSVRAVCTGSGLTSRHAAERYGGAFCTSDPQEVLRDPAINAVVIATRHGEHARLAGAALAAGKAVFLEKPLAISEAELASLAAAAGHTPPLLVGFNRRFSPLAADMRAFLQGRGPLTILYRVNAGRVPNDSWVLDPVEGGGRIVGEVCHFVDFACFLTGALPERVFAEQVRSAASTPGDRDAVVITLRMADGSVATIQYVCSGDTSVSKEYCEAAVGGRTAVLDNYRSLTTHAGNKRSRRRLLNQAKGHAEEAAAFVAAVAGGTPMPIDFATLVAVTQATFLVHRSLEEGMSLAYVPPALDEPGSRP
jgi:predicted dehydrogenase/threonine dehydrogenase-like Zn-dependent dehydrogenase